MKTHPKCKSLLGTIRSENYSATLNQVQTHLLIISRAVLSPVPAVLLMFTTIVTVQVGSTLSGDLPLNGIQYHTID